jgi:hypothetical protein
MQWTPERIEALRRKIVDERKPSQVVAAELTREFGFRVTRNSVMGKADRLGLQFAQARPRRPAASLPAVMAIRDFQCRWIEDGDYCARPTVHSQSWCAEHRARAWLRR